MLRSSPQNCDMVIALTHMRCPNDRELARAVPEIDLVLGGHDHSYVTEVDERTGVFLIKSGTDFEQFNDFEVFLDVSEEEFKSSKSQDSELIKHLYSKQKNIMVRVEKVPITNEISKDPEVEKHIKKATQGLNAKMN